MPLEYMTTEQAVTMSEADLLAHQAACDAEIERLRDSKRVCAREIQGRALRATARAKLAALTDEERAVLGIGDDQTVQATPGHAPG